MSQNDDAGAPRRAKGYGLPPVEYQFKKGRSGNPLGRPPKKRAPEINFDNIVLDELCREVRVRDENGSQAMLVAQVMVRKASASAMNGSEKAQKLMMLEARRAQAGMATREARLYDEADEYKAFCDMARDHAAKHGWAAPAFDPDPDDIILDPRKRSVSLHPRALRRQSTAKADMQRMLERLTEEQRELALISKLGNSVLVQRDLERLERIRAALTRRL